MQALLKDLIHSVRDKGTYRTNPQSFVEVFLQKMESSDRSSEYSLILTEENLITVLYDFFTAAGDTTAGTMAFGLLWLVLHPEVQEKCYQEIVSVVGSERLPVLTDKESMPYVRATILEIHRRSTIAPLLPHKVFKDTKFQGFLIPKNTNVLINIYSSQMDPEMWEDPDSFRSARFLNSKGDVVVNEHKLLTFSIGKRDCPGKAVAEMAIFSFLTGIVKKYKLVPPTTDHKYDTRPVFGGGLSPSPFEVQVERRLGAE